LPTACLLISDMHPVVALHPCQIPSSPNLSHLQCYYECCPSYGKPFTNCTPHEHHDREIFLFLRNLEKNGRSLQVVPSLFVHVDSTQPQAFAYFAIIIDFEAVTDHSSNLYIAAGRVSHLSDLTNGSSSPSLETLPVDVQPL